MVASTLALKHEFRHLSVHTLACGCCDVLADAACISAGDATSSSELHSISSAEPLSCSKPLSTCSLCHMCACCIDSMHQDPSGTG